MKRRYWAVVLLLIWQGALAAANEAPRWLAAAMQGQIFLDISGAPAVVLWHEVEAAVDGGGKITSTEHYAVRILKKEGCQEARAMKYYAPDTDKVHELRGWMASRSGQVRALEKDRVADVEEGDSFYEQARVRMLSATAECGEGVVFAYESVMEERSVFTQLAWQFQDRLPVVVSRFTLRLPGGWESKAVTLNHAAIAARVTGNSSTWELRDLPYLEAEPDAPRLGTLAPRLAVSLFPTSKTTMGETFANWVDVSRYATALHDPQGMPDAAITAKAQALTAEAHSEIEKIRAIAFYVQKLRYVSIQMGIGRGGGYKPHAASLVLTKGYGDCKDKATLMRAMLRAIGITSYPVLIYAGDASYVHEEWPSPHQFNHCIIAIVVSDAVNSYAVAQVPIVGRVLIFDSTDPYTPLGEIPDDEQSSFALVAAGEKGALIRVPKRPARTNRRERITVLQLDADGSLRGTSEERFSGDMAVRARATYGEDHDLTKTMEQWMAAQAPGVSVSSAQPSDSFTENTYRVLMDFTAPHYAQLMQNRLLVFRPGAVPRSDHLPGHLRLTEANRKYPMVIKGESFRETVNAKLPAGFAVDETPEGEKVEGDLGVFETHCTSHDGEVTWSRSLELKGQVIPAERYAEAKRFFQRIADAEAQPVVLIRK